MNKLVALAVSTSVIMSIVGGIGINQKVSLNKNEVTKKVVSINDIESKVVSLNYSKINEDKNYIKYMRTSLLEEIKIIDRDKAIKIVADKYDYDEGQLTVGKMNNNVYLVNFFDDTESSNIVNLFLVVNGEVIDKKYNEDNTLSVSFVDNFMKYQEVDPVQEYLESIIVANQEGDETLVAQGISTMLYVKSGYDMKNVEVRKINNSMYIADCINNNKKERLTIMDGKIVVENKQTQVFSALN
ncbi:hypothetical protein [Oceanirhabdus sp. W0125-5]|uniref:hypothetical protein n=1 Tax=Oceanirhabdus sp. W0125-5 TaxID=2999116 RepID=UPI0022F33FEB|nr:hypothetical protein [Oceanirhabdus sp. W0125-5]WBW98201.1 hypothetical protein OW730_05395 [Oceanirhabdus sp. W0125-5]